MKFAKGDAQGNSPFFRQLSADVRRLIYIELFGSRRVHISHAGAGSGCFTREGHPEVHLTLWHCVCRKPGKLPHRHYERNHKWCYLTTNILFTCKWAYEEGLRVLYSTNAFIFDNSFHWKMFAVQSARYLPCLRNLEFEISEREGSDTDCAFEMKAICNDLVRLTGNYTARFMIISKHKDQKMEMEELLRPLKKFNTWAVNATFQITLLEKAKEHTKKPFQWACEKLQIRPRPTLTFVTEEPLNSGEDSDDENFGLQLFDHQTMTHFGGDLRNDTWGAGNVHWPLP